MSKFIYLTDYYTDEITPINVNNINFVKRRKRGCLIFMAGMYLNTVRVKECLAEVVQLISYRNAPINNYDLPTDDEE